MVSWCCMCRCSKEIVDHLLIHCSVAFEFWSMIFRMFGFSGYYRRRFLICYMSGIRGPISNI